MKGLGRFTKQLFGKKTVDRADLSIVDGVVTDNCGTLMEPLEIDRELTDGIAEFLSHTEDCFREVPEFVEPEPPAEDFEEPVSPSEQVNPEEWEVPDPYLIYMSASGKAARTIQEYKWDLLWWNRKESLMSITLQDMERVISGLHPSTARRKIAAIRSYGKWQLREGDSRLHNELARIVLPKTPTRVPKDKGSTQFMEFSKCAVDLVRAGDRRVVWLGLMGCCGLRISEIQTVEQAPGKKIRVIGKGDKERLVPAPGWLYQALGCDSFPKCWRKGRQLIWEELNKMGIRKPHSLRHTFASELRRKGYPLEDIKVLLGHSKLDTTLVYANVALPNDVSSRLGVEH